MKKIGVAIKAMVSGNSPSVIINRGEWSRKLGDIRRILRHVPAMEADHQLFTTFFFFDEGGCYVVLARTMINRNFDNIAGWIYLPAVALITGADVKDIIGIVKDLISKSELPSYEQLEEHFGSRFFEERDPTALIASPGNNKFAMRNLTAHSLEEILGENRYQEYYADYEAIFIEESPGEIIDATDISDMPIEAPASPEPEPELEPELEPEPEPILPPPLPSEPLPDQAASEETLSQNYTPEETYTGTPDDDSVLQPPVPPIPMQEEPVEDGQTEQLGYYTENEKKNYGTTFIIVAIVGVFVTIGVWGFMFKRHEQLTKQRAHDIMVYNDSITMLTERQLERKDSINNAAEIEAREGIPQAKDFISMRTRSVEVYNSEYGEWMSVSTKAPEYKMDAPEQLERRGYTLVHSRRSKDEGEGGFYQSYYRMYEKLIRGTGYVRVLIHEGPCDEVVIYFPNAEVTKQFLTQLSSLGYVKRDDGYGYTEYRVPVKYSVYGSRQTDYDALHDMGQMVVFRDSNDSNEITISTSGCI